MNAMNSICKKKKVEIYFVLDKNNKTYHLKISQHSYQPVPHLLDVLLSNSCRHVWKVQLVQCAQILVHPWNIEEHCSSPQQKSSILH